MLIEYSEKFDIATDIEKQLEQYSLLVSDNLLNFWRNNPGGYLLSYEFCFNNNNKYIPNIILGFSHKDISENVVLNYKNETQFWDSSFIAVLHFDGNGGIYYNTNSKRYFLIDDVDKKYDLGNNIEDILSNCLIKRKED